MLLKFGIYIRNSPFISGIALMLFLAMFNSFLLAPARCCSSKMCSEKSVKRQNDRQTFGAFREAVVHGPFRCFMPRRRLLARNVTFVSSFRCLPSLLSESHFMKCNCFFCFFFFFGKPFNNTDESA